MMPLKSGEKVLYKAKIHRFCYVFPMALLGLGLLVMFSPTLQPNPESALYGIEMEVENMINLLKSMIPEALWPYLVTFQAFRTNYLGLLLTVLGGMQVISAFLHRNFSRFWITNKRIIAQTSLVRNRLQEIALDRLAHIRIHHGLIGHIIGRGTLLINDTGMREIEIKHLSKPDHFKELAKLASESYRKQGSK